jgi:rRNA maturation endonuclease Nob1
MSLQSTIYCLDANVLIKAWESYYSPDLCPTYWDVLDDLGAKGQLFVPSWVAEEIHRTDDDLSKWLMKSRIKVRQVSEEVTLKVREVFAKDKRMNCSWITPSNDHLPIRG